jgi:hypothetical protein
LYEGNLDAERYMKEILNPFFVNLASAENRLGWFMGDSTTLHTAKEAILA